MTPSELKQKHEENRATLWFNRDTMKFFGDTMKNFGCYQDEIVSSFDSEGNYHVDGVQRHVYVLYRKRTKANQRKIAAYFCADTFRICFAKD